MEFKYEKGKKAALQNLVNNTENLSQVVNKNDLKAVVSGGLNFAGNKDMGDEIHKNISETLTIKGEGTDSMKNFQSASGNLQIASENGELVAKINKNLQNFESLSFKNGDKIVKINASENGNLDLNNKKIENLAKGTADTDGVNISQLKDIIGIIGGETTIQNGDITTNNIGGTGKNTINGAIEYVNNKATNGSPYLKFDETDKTPAKASGKNSSAIGVGASSSGENYVSIGYNSNDNGRANTISVGSTGNERTISNVAPGVLGTDAVNVNQLNSVANNLNNAIADVRDDANAGVAGAVALGMLPQSNIPGHTLYAIGSGYYEGESAVSLGISRISDNARWVFKGGVTYNSQENMAAGASIGFHY